MRGLYRLGANREDCVADASLAPEIDGSRGRRFKWRARVLTEQAEEKS